MKRDSLKIKLIPKEEEQEVHVQVKEEDKRHLVARGVKDFTGTSNNPEISFTFKFVHMYY